MKNDLTCGVVRDLLPSYVENLLGEDSREAVDRHLAGCPACTAQKNAMAAQAAGAPEPEETVKEVDYLKRVKKGTFKKIAVAVVCTVLILLGCAALKLFVIGTPLQPQSVAVITAEVQDEGSCLYLSLMSMGSGNAFHGWKVETKDGVASIYARDVLVSPLHRTGNAQVYVPLENVREVWLGGISGWLLWAEGLLIPQKTLDLVEAKTPYCGDAPALSRIAELLQISQTLGPYAMSLQTSQEPYTWNLEFQKAWGSEKQPAFRVCAYQMLALVENLDQITYTYEPENGHGRTREDRLTEGSVNAQRASQTLARLTERYNDLHHTNWPVHESIKEYAESPLEYQRMVTLLTERFIYEF